MTCKCAAWLSHAENICGATYPRFQNMKSVHALPDNVLKTERPGRNKSYVPLCNRRCSVPTASALPEAQRSSPAGPKPTTATGATCFFLRGSVIASSTCCRNAFDAFDMIALSTLLREHLVSQKCEHTRPVTATSELLFQPSDTQSA